MTITATHLNQNETHQSSNLLDPCIDEAVGPRGRGPRPGGHMWVHLWGRDWVVRKPTKLGFIGTALGSLGVVGLGWESVDHFQPGRVGVMLVIVGAILICYKRLETKNLAADEIYNLGRERGEGDMYDEGYKDGYREGVTKGERRRPHVVARLPHCSNCGTATALHSVASVADRV